MRCRRVWGDEGGDRRGRDLIGIDFGPQGSLTKVSEGKVVFDISKPVGCVGTK